MLGTGRCGSSLLCEIIARHPDVGFISNMDDRLARLRLRGRWNNAIYRRVPQALTRKGRIRFAPSEGYRILEREVSPLVVAPPRDLVAEDAGPWLADPLRETFHRRATAQGRPLFLHKFTGWPRTGLLSAALPDARFVHVVRDGRAVAASMVRMPWWTGVLGPDAWSWGPLPASYREEWEASGRSYPVLAGLQWKMLLDSYDAARDRLPGGRWLEVRYEDLLADPRGVVGEVSAFLGLRSDAGFDRAVDGYGLDGSRAGAFRSSLAPSDVAALEGSLMDHLRRRGYQVSVPEGETVV
jgi:hypothetical protein